MADDELNRLTTASDGLEYPSESDTPFGVVRWPATAGIENVVDVVNARFGKKRKVTQVPVESFFAELSGADDAERFVQLRRVLELTVADLGVFRVGDGETKVDIYLVGKSKGGDWLGLHTSSIET